MQGNIVLTKTGPSMARTVWGNPERYYTSYWEKYAEQGWFLAGDGARFDDDGDIWILGRTDDVINISGHRLSTIEIESALVTHPAVVEAGVCPTADAKTGHAATAFVVPFDKSIVGTSLPVRGAGQAAGPACRAPPPRCRADRPDRQAARHRLRARRAQDPLGQDHAAAADPALRGKHAGDTTSLQNEPCIAQIKEICEG